MFDDYITIPSETTCRAIHGKGLKILTPKQMLQRLAIAAAQIKTSNPSENLLNEFWQIMHSLHWTKKITKIL